MEKNLKITISLLLFCFFAASHAAGASENLETTLGNLKRSQMNGCVPKKEINPPKLTSDCSVALRESGVSGIIGNPECVQALRKQAQFLSARESILAQQANKYSN